MANSMPVGDRRRDWYKDAIIYEVHVRAFFDSNGDGMGDFRGLTQKLDYLQDLGVTAIWLLPFYPSPLARRRLRHRRLHRASIRPTARCGTSRLSCGRRTARGLRVITELVLNHTSRPARLVSAVPPCRARHRAGANFYVWSDTPEKYQDARIIFKDFETSNWTWDPVAKAYYWHRFYSHQPDLNFDNPEVRKAMLSAVDFWLGHGRGRPAAGRGAVPVRARGDELREPPGDARVPEEAAGAHRRAVSRTGCCWRRRTSGRRTRSPISATATNATWRSISR